jgi:hypothetical protein
MGLKVILLLARFSFAAAIVSNGGSLAGEFRGSLVKRLKRLGPWNVLSPVERNETMNLITYGGGDIPDAGQIAIAPGLLKRDS